MAYHDSPGYKLLHKTLVVDNLIWPIAAQTPFGGKTSDWLLLHSKITRREVIITLADISANNKLVYATLVTRTTYSES